MAIAIDTDQCENTGVCAMVCPEDVIEMRDSQPILVSPAACTSCWKCVETCVSAAISLD